MIKEKTKIVIASVLKPVDDVRNCEKIGNSLGKESGYEIHVMGTQGTTHPNPNITTHSWRKFKRLSFGRIKVQFQFWREVYILKPRILIITTHELLFTATLLRLLTRVKLVYDIQEDYFKNLWHQRFYPPVFRHLLALTLRTNEYLFSPFISLFLLAEKTYQNDIGFLGKRAIVLDNKSLEIPHSPKDNSFKVVFTGTVSHYSKAREAAALFVKVREHIPNAKMTIIGYSPKASYRFLLQSEFGSELNLKVSNEPVPHHEIIEEISSANLAILSYQPDPVNRNKMPTKLYEYIVADLPFLVQENTLWSREGKRLGNAIDMDFTIPDIPKIIADFDKIELNSKDKSECLWSNNETIITQSITSILTSNK